MFEGVLGGGSVGEEDSLYSLIVHKKRDRKSIRFDGLAYNVASSPAMMVSLNSITGLRNSAGCVIQRCKSPAIYSRHNIQLAGIMTNMLGPFFNSPTRRKA